MSQQARFVLQDCKVALEDLRAAEATGVQWRIRWIAVVALLRAVGHVLDKVDGAQSPQLRAAINKEFERLKASKPEPRIFWDFIEAERNNILKVYQFGARQSVTVRLGMLHVNFKTGEQWSDSSGPTIYTYEMATEPFVGQKPHQVVEQAIAWWEHYLDEIEKHAKQP